MTRPDYVKCVQHDHEDLKGKSWCGRDVHLEWHFVGVDHAANNGRNGGRLVACPKCVGKIIVALQNGAKDIPETPE